MTCQLLSDDAIAELFSHGRQRVSLDDLLMRPDGELDIAYAVGAHAQVLRRAGGGTYRIEGDLLDAEWAADVLGTIIALSRTHARLQAAQVLRLVYRLAKAPGLRDGEVLNALYQVFAPNNRSPTYNSVVGALFVWRWLDDWNLWEAVRRFEYAPGTRPGQRTHVFDVSLGDDMHFELKNWSGVNAANFQRYARTQILADLEQGPLTSAFWIFSDRLLQGPGAPTREGFADWIRGEVDDIVNAASGPTAPTIRANWQTLRTQGIASRVMLHDTDAARALAAPREEFEEMFDALNEWRNRAAD